MKFIWLILFLSGCSILSTVPPPVDWPQLKTLKFQVDNDEFYKLCGPSFPPLYIVAACSFIVFRNMTCVQVERARFPMTESMQAHEDGHCLGFDHVGSTTLADEWAKWKDKK